MDAKNGFIINQSPSQIRLVRQKIRDQVMREYQQDLQQATGWRKRVLIWKLNMITEIRYRGILCMGAAATLPEESQVI